MGDRSSTPVAFFITFSCYGARLPGDETGSVDRCHNQIGTPFLAPDSDRVANALQEMDHPAYIMDSSRRTIVLQSICEVCNFKKWELLAVHVRSNHVHIVVRAESRPELIMNSFKAYSSRNLNAAGLDGPECKRWARHGSTRYLWTEEVVKEKVHYTLFEQGEPMALFAGPGI